MGTSDDYFCSAQRQHDLEGQVQALSQEQVAALESKLGHLHTTDVTSLRRAYRSLAQHVEALDVESKHLPALLDRATEPAVTPEFVAEQTRRAATITAVVYAVGRLLRLLRVPDAGPISLALALLGAGYMGVRLAAGALRRLGVAALRRQQAQEELRLDVLSVLDRIRVMADLADSGMRLHRLHPSQQQQQPPSGQPQLGQLPPPPQPQPAPVAPFEPAAVAGAGSSGSSAPGDAAAARGRIATSLVIH